MENDWTDCPVLVYGPRKSGTTLLQNLLDGGSDILMLPGELKIKYALETENSSTWEKIIQYLTIGKSIWIGLDIFQFNNADKTIYSSKEHIKEIKIGTLGSDQLQKIFNIDTYISILTTLGDQKIESTTDIYRFDLNAHCSAIVKQQDYRYWACKEVGGRPHVILPYFKALFPKAKIILIARSPFYIIRSIILDRRRKEIRLSTIKIIKECHKAWQILTSFSRMDFGGDIFLLFYEDIISNTKVTMQRICKFLNIPFNKIYTLPTTMSINSIVATSSIKTKEVIQTQPKSWVDHLRFQEVVAILLYSLVSKVWHLLCGYPRFSYDQLRKKP